MQIEIELRRRIIGLALLWTAGVSLLRTIRWPNDWSEAHWLISYELGFLKRALPGTVIRPLLEIDSFAPEWVIRVAATAVFVLFCVALFWMASRFLESSREGVTAQLAVLVFATSPFFVMSAHLNGYYDGLILLASIGACWLVLRGRVVAAAIVMGAGLLVHESVLLVGYPCVLLAGWMRASREREREGVGAGGGSDLAGDLVSFLREHAILITLPLGVFLVLFVYQNFFVDPAALKASLQAHFESYDFILRNKDRAVARAYSTPFSEYFDSQARFFRQRVMSRGYQLEVLPPVALLLYHFWRCVAGLRSRGWLLVAALVITLLPLALHAVAWDTGRVWMYPIVVAALLVWCAHEVWPPESPESRWALAGYVLLASIVIVAQIYGTTPLLDKQVERFDALERTLLYAPTLAFGLVTIGASVWLRQRRTEGGQR